MKKIFALLLALCLLVPYASLAEEEKVLNIFTWQGYIDDETLKNFTEETGIKTNYSTFSTNEEMLLKMSAAPGEYDLILASDYAINMLRKQDLLYKLDKEELPNYGNIGEGYLSQYFDENNEYAIPYTAGMPLIIYDPALVDFEITGYESLWDERLKDSIVMIDDARNIIGITLKTMGESFNTTDDEVLKKAEEKLMALRPNIRSFNYDSPHFDIISGECSVGYLFTSFLTLALHDRPDLKVVYPEEGLGFGIDALVISKNAPHPLNAHKLINYLLDAKVGAHIAQLQGYICPNAAAYEFLPESIQDNPALNIPAEKLENTEFIQDLGEYESVYQAIWQRFKLQ